MTQARLRDPASDTDATRREPSGDAPRLLGQLPLEHFEHLIGRSSADADLEDGSDHLTGRRVLVTGAGGSIGTELCHRIRRRSPESLVAVDHDETALHALGLAVAADERVRCVLADVRDAPRVREVLTQSRPDVVFHAAALKHLPVLESNPDEAWKTNVLGTRNVVDAARAAGASVLVNLSSDKAANPSSVLGKSKLLSEVVTARAAEASGRRFLSVRFGNVLATRGSVLTTFIAQIDRGEDLSITHPDVTRYFMTVAEACELVLRAGAIGRAGESLLLDMGRPVRILDVAEALIAMSRREVGVRVVGLRPGEKLHEDLLGAGEVATSPVHARVTHARVAADDPGVAAIERELRPVGDRTSLAPSPAAVDPDAARRPLPLDGDLN